MCERDRLADPEGEILTNSPKPIRQAAVPIAKHQTQATYAENAYFLVHSWEVHAGPGTCIASLGWGLSWQRERAMVERCVRTSAHILNHESETGIAVQFPCFNENCFMRTTEGLCENCFMFLLNPKPPNRPHHPPQRPCHLQ